MTNSEMFEKVARGEITPEDATARLLESDEAHRKQLVDSAKPAWLPAAAWIIVSFLVIATIDAFDRRI